MLLGGNKVKTECVISINTEGFLLDCSLGGFNTLLIFIYLHLSWKTKKKQCLKSILVSSLFLYCVQSY